jgi:hypothetical protein
MHGLPEYQGLSKLAQSQSTQADFTAVRPSSREFNRRAPDAP